MTGQDSHDARFEQWDGAYVLGALGPDDRRAYEEHLRSCERCRAEVAELGGMPGLLSRVPTTRALGLIGESADGIHGADGAEVTPPADLAERLQRRARQRRRRPLLVAAGAGIAAAILVVAGVLGVRTFTTPTPTVTADLQPTSAVGNPGELTAQVQLFAKGWGTEIDTRCDHKVSAGGGSYAGTGYGLFVVDASGRSTLVSSWQGVRQSPISTTAATATKINDMRRLELRNLVDNTLLLSAPVRG